MIARAAAGELQECGARHVLHGPPSILLSERRVFVDGRGAGCDSGRRVLSRPGTGDERVELALRGRDDGPGDALPAPAARGRPRRKRRSPPRRSASGRREPAVEAVGDRADRIAARAGRRSGRRRRPGRSSASAPATSARPEWSAQTGSAPVAAASAATMPKASGNVLGTTIASLARTASATSRVLEPAGPVDRAGGARGRPRRSRRGGSARKAPRQVERRLLPALERPAEPGDLAGVVEVAGGERRRRGGGGRRGTRRSRPSAGARRGGGRRRAARRRAAGRSPWRRSACRRRRPAGPSAAA